MTSVASDEFSDEGLAAPVETGDNGTTVQEGGVPATEEVPPGLAAIATNVDPGVLRLLTEISKTQAATTAALTSLQEKIAARPEREPDPPVRQRGLETVPVFDGRYDEWETFKNRLMAFLGDERGWTALLVWAGKFKDEITDAVLDE